MGFLDTPAFHATMWALGGAMLLHVLQRVVRGSERSLPELLREWLSEARKVVVISVAVVAAFALARFVSGGPGVIGAAGTFAFVGGVFGVAGVMGLFLARQFLAPPWWRLNAWSPEGVNHAYDGGERDIVAWVVSDASRVLRGMRPLDRIMVLAGTPALAWDASRVLGVERVMIGAYGLLLILYVALAVALFTANRIPRVLMTRVQELRRVAHRIAGGDLTARAGTSELGDYQELGQLVADFNTMARSLQGREHENQLLQHQLQATLHHEQERATRDPLTSLRNHRYFQESLHAELDRSSRSGAACTIAIIDLDNFKQVNDTFGHQEGDAVLQRMSATLLGMLRPYDLACRLGGEEFGVIFPETDALEAKAVLDRIMGALAQSGPQGRPLTFSGGVSTYPEHSGEQATLFQIADEAAYTAKMRGKAQTVIYDPATVVRMDSQERRDQRERDAVLNTAKTLVNTVDAKDSFTRDHSELVGRYSSAIAQAMGLGDEMASQMYLCGLLHDVGKIGISDSIIAKRGRLTAEEFEEVKRHPELSYEIVRNAGMEDLAVWVRHHHERWDGSGYPDGLAGEEIPLGSRIVAVAEAYEVMTSDRVYRRSLPPAQAIEELRGDAGTKFDPRVVEVLAWLIVNGHLQTGMGNPSAAAASGPRLFEHGQPQAAVDGDPAPQAAVDGDPAPQAAVDGDPVPQVPRDDPAPQRVASWPPAAAGEPHDQAA